VNGFALSRVQEPLFAGFIASLTTIGGHFPSTTTPDAAYLDQTMAYRDQLTAYERPPFVQPFRANRTTLQSILTLDASIEDGSFEQWTRVWRDAEKSAAEELSEGVLDPPNLETWTFAWGVLTQLVMSNLISLPIVMPLQSGGVGAEWHEAGLNIELRFRSPTRVYCLIEDAKCTLSRFSGFEGALTAATMALNVLAQRTGCCPVLGQ
jgi:hypothetical protein